MKETTVDMNGHAMRVWSKGSGQPIGYFPGYGGALKWTPFLDKLAETRTVIVPSLPGFPGGRHAHLDLDTQLDWMLAVHDLLSKSGLDGADLIGTGFGGALAADAAACWTGMVRKLILISPWGIYDEADPVTNVWAQPPGATPKLLCADPKNFTNLLAPPNDIDEGEWKIIQVRADEAAARFLWPLGDTGLVKRLDRISQDTLLIWGDKDRVVPQSYAKKFADRISGKSDIKKIKDAGHLAELDQPEAVAKAILAFAA